MRIVDYRITRFQYARDRVIGDSQVRIDASHVAALELIADNGMIGLGFVGSLFNPLPDEAEIVRVFEEEAWLGLKDQPPAALVHRVGRPRGGNQRGFGLPFGEAIQVALWDLAAKQAGLPLHKLLGSRRDKVEAYASGLDYHLSDAAFTEFFGHADALGYRAFKIKVGNPEFEWDLHRLELLKRTVRKDALVMIDANEAWGAKETIAKLEVIRAAGHELLWVEDPILRNDFEGLKLLRESVGWTMINSGEYLDVSGKRQLLLAGGTDILNVHNQVTDVMRIGWLAAELGIPVSLGNTFLETGIHMAAALPEVQWLEYSFQNYDHLVDEPISETARRDWRRPKVLARSELGEAPFNPRVKH
jgi:L-alanine-DL-glutamate epimerase-like enolase superfamily enzyme